MLDGPEGLDRRLRDTTIAAGPAITGALERAAAAIARLDQALQNHPLRPAFLYRARLEAVRRQAGVDGQAIDPWHLAAVLEGLRLRMGSALRIIDRGAIFAAARHALDLHQWLVEPDFDQEGEVRLAEQALAATAGSPLLAAAHWLHAWLGGDGRGSGNGQGSGDRGGGTRAPARAALVRHWTKHRLLRAPVPLTGPQALRPDVDWGFSAWAPCFLRALADEADESLQLLLDLERAWFAARGAVAGRRRTSRAAAAIDLLAAAPLLSATTLAQGLGMAVKNAAALLDQFHADGIAVEVTHRSKRRLYGLAGLAPLRDEVAPPYRPMPGLPLPQPGGGHGPGRSDGAERPSGARRPGARDGRNAGTVCAARRAANR
ncbi:MAG: hypothetical protein J0H14_06675 [Alphaproteobacteria bacterium]|nr:hypothetical protein [Alphaproteobacteria bacterium]